MAMGQSMGQLEYFFNAKWGKGIIPTRVPTSMNSLQLACQPVATLHSGCGLRQWSRQWVKAWHVPWIVSIAIMSFHVPSRSYQGHAGWIGQVTQAGNDNKVWSTHTAMYGAQEHIVAIMEMEDIQAMHLWQYLRHCPPHAFFPMDPNFVSSIPVNLVWCSSFRPDHFLEPWKLGSVPQCRLLTTKKQDTNSDTDISKLNILPPT